MHTKFQNIEACFLGLAIGDALGVPVEFRKRDYLLDKPVTTMMGYGVWNQPPGTWSDDSSLTFCTAESLVAGYNLTDMGKRFMRWFKEGYWGAHDVLFDIGNTTRIALNRIYHGEDALYSGEFDATSNGNGSLMRIMPAALYFRNSDDNALFTVLREVSGITHAHIRSILSCFIYTRLVHEILNGHDKAAAWSAAARNSALYFRAADINADEVALFNRLLQNDITSLPEKDIQSSGYVLHTLEASIWCFLTTDNYTDAVLKAVNLGGDTDTTGCVTGALAGLYYGNDGIPAGWIDTVVRKKDICSLAAAFSAAVEKR